MPTEMLLRRPASVIGRSGWKSSSCLAVTFTSGALARVLIRRRHVLVEHRLRHRHQARMRDPGAVAAVGDLAQLVLAHLLDRGFVRRRIVLDRDLRRHAAHRRRAAPVAGLDQQQRVGAHERRGHRHLRAVGEAEILVGAEFLDAGKDVVPAPDVEARRVVAQLVQDLVHLERGDHRLDQRGGLDAALRNPKFVLRERRRCRSTAAPRGATPSSAGRSTGPSRAPAAPWRYGRSTARSRRCRRTPACRRR